MAQQNPAQVRDYTANLRPLPADHQVIRYANRFNILIVVCGGTVAEDRVERTIESVYQQIGEESVEVKVVLTASSLHFIDPATIYRRFPNVAVYGEKHKYEAWALVDRTKPAFILLTRWADKIVAIPATASCLAYLVRGDRHSLATLCLGTGVVECAGGVSLYPSSDRSLMSSAPNIQNIASLQSVKHPFQIMLGVNYGYAVGQLPPTKIIIEDLLEAKFEKEFAMSVVCEESAIAVKLLKAKRCRHGVTEAELREAMCAQSPWYNHVFGEGRIPHECFTHLRRTHRIYEINGVPGLYRLY